MYLTLLLYYIHMKYDLALVNIIFVILDFANDLGTLLNCVP